MKRDLATTCSDGIRKKSKLNNNNNTPTTTITTTSNGNTATASEECKSILLSYIISTHRCIIVFSPTTNVPFTPADQPIGKCSLLALLMLNID